MLTQLTVNRGWTLDGSGLPNVFAGQVIDLVFRRGSPAPLQISGVFGNGERYQFPLSPVATPNAALKLLWARRRIEKLTASGQSASALALAKQHNLLCEGAAFVAWDEAEEVMLAQREIIQPSLEQAVLAGRMSASAYYYVAPLMSQAEDGPARFFSPRRSAEASDDVLESPEEPLHSMAPPDDLRSELILASVDEDLAQALAEWADAKWFRRRARRLAVTKLISLLKAPPFDLTMKALFCRRFIIHELDREPALSARLLALVNAWERRVQV